MDLVCSQCQTPFTLSREDKVAALRRMKAENLNYYDAICPLGHVNLISRERLENATPGWEMESSGQMGGMSRPSQPVSSGMPSSTPPARESTAPMMRPARPEPTTPTKMEKPAMKPAARKPAKKKTTAKAKVKKTARPAARKAVKKTKAPARKTVKKTAARKPAAKKTARKTVKKTVKKTARKVTGSKSKARKAAPRKKAATRRR